MSERAVEVLLVEDDPLDVQLMFRELPAIRDKIKVARDGEEALDFIFGSRAGGERSAPQQLKVVFLDLKLPKIDGLEVLRTIKADEETRAIPVVVLTSSNEERDLVASYKLGANSFVQKPVSFERFRQALHALGLYWLDLNQPPPQAFVRT
jgi:two-component system, response regulator